MAPVKLAAPIPEGTVMVDVQPSTKPGMEGVQETAGKIAVERKLQDEVIISSSYSKGVMFSRNLLKSLFALCSYLIPVIQGEQVYNTLKQQEEMRISGKSARQMVMQVGELNCRP